MNISSRRARQVALVAFVLNILFLAASLVISAVSGSAAVLALSWQILASVFVWLILVAIFHQRTLAEQEKLDMAQLAKSKGGDTIFQASAERSELFAVAQRRLQILEKWFVPGFGVLLAVYEIGLGLRRILNLTGGIDYKLENAQLSAVFMAAIAFMSFLVSRYATGMSAKMEWKPLRAGGSYMLATAIMAFSAAVGLALGQFKMYGLIDVLAWVIPILLIVLGVETALNTVLDIYRPRISGQYSRSAFDSRLLGLFNEPGGILHTFASAIDYQFGFKVSQTWFYKLLEEAILPLVLFSIVTLYLLSSVVVIEPGDEAIVERLGAFHRIAKPGLSFKLPWPMDKAYKHPTTRIQQVNVGFVVDEEDTKREPLLWGQAHYKEEDKLLLAAESDGSSEEDVPVSLVVAAVPVHYRVNDLQAYEYNHADSDRMLKTICYRELVRYAASATIETDENGTDESLLGAGREKAAKVLKSRVQEKADAAKLGVEVVFLGLQGVHPPEDVAKDYEEVVAAVQKKQAAIMGAQAEQNEVLVSLCGGSVAQANKLYELATKYQVAKETGSTNTAEQLGMELSNAIKEASGEIFAELSEAQSYAFEKEVLAEATGERFVQQIKPLREMGKAPEIYVRHLRLAMLEELLPEVRKYVVLTKKGDTQIFEIDLQEDLANTLMDINMDVIEEMKNR